MQLLILFARNIASLEIFPPISFFDRICILAPRYAKMAAFSRPQLHSISLFGDTALKQTSSMSAFEKMQGPTTEVGRLNRLLQEKQQLVSEITTFSLIL